MKYSSSSSCTTVSSQTISILYQSCFLLFETIFENFIVFCPKLAELTYLCIFMSCSTLALLLPFLVWHNTLSNGFICNKSVGWEHWPQQFWIYSLKSLSSSLASVPPSCRHIMILSDSDFSDCDDDDTIVETMKHLLKMQFHNFHFSQMIKNTHWRVAVCLYK